MIHIVLVLCQHKNIVLIPIDFKQLGRLITVHVNKYQKEGEYKVRWSAENLPGGVYIIYEIRADNFIRSAKMLLLK